MLCKPAGEAEEAAIYLDVLDAQRALFAAQQAQAQQVQNQVVLYKVLG